MYMDREHAGTGVCRALTSDMQSAMNDSGLIAFWCVSSLWRTLIRFPLTWRKHLDRR